MQQRTVLAAAAATVAVLGTSVVAGAAISGARVFGLGGNGRRPAMITLAASDRAGTSPPHVVTRTEYEDQRVVVTTTAPMEPARHDSTLPAPRPAATSAPAVATVEPAPAPGTPEPETEPTEPDHEQPHKAPSPTTEPSPALPSTPPTEPAPVQNTTSPTTTPPPAPSPVQTIDTAAGAIHVQVVGSSLTVTSVDAPGFQVETSVSGTRATVHFESSSQEYEVHISLSNGQVTWHYDN
jgi:hypothetical protein